MTDIMSKDETGFVRRKRSQDYWCWGAVGC